MKAIYQKPVTEAVMLSTGTYLLDTSNGILGKGDEPAGFDLDKPVNETDETSGNLSRRTVWDDEEEE